MVTKSENRNKKILNKVRNGKILKPKYDLEDRVKIFSKDLRKYFKNQEIKFYTMDDIKQVLRSSGSIGANYIEANESLSKKDFLYRIKIAKKEAKESLYWIDILLDSYEDLIDLRRECKELMLILGSIYSKSV